MQVVDDERAQPLNLVRRRYEIRNHDRHHAGSRRRSDTHVGILKGKAERRRHAQQAGRHQERIRLGLVALAIVMRHDVMEAIDHAVGLEVTADGRAR